MANWERTTETQKRLLHEVQTAVDALELAQQRLLKAQTAAHDGGVSYAAIGRACGVTGYAVRLRTGKGSEARSSDDSRDDSPSAT